MPSRCLLGAALKAGRAVAPPAASSFSRRRRRLPFAPPTLRAPRGPWGSVITRRTVAGQSPPGRPARAGSGGGPPPPTPPGGGPAPGAGASPPDASAVLDRLRLPHPPDSDDARFAFSLLLRILSAFGIVHVVHEHGLELILTSGPSMSPTMRPSGEMVLLEKFTPGLFGLDGGSGGEERARIARVRQLEWEASLLGRRGGVRNGGGGGAGAEGGDDDDDDGDGPAKPTWHQPRQLPASHPSNATYRSLLTRLTTGVSAGDVLVLHRPYKGGTVCKRVLGLPGDLIVMAGDNDDGGANLTEAVRRRRAETLVENVLEDEGGVKYLWGEASKSKSQRGQQQQLRVVPDGHVWIEGDNSVDSIDSRCYGPVPAAMIVGRVVCRVWPLRGSALMGRGERPVERGRPFSGSIVLPAGYEGERIVSQDEN